MADPSADNPAKLSEIFERGMQLADALEDAEHPSNSDEYQEMVKKGIELLEKTTHMVNEIGVFSTNETIEEVATEDVKYLLLPALLGYLSFQVKFTTMEQRLDHIRLSELYYKDFLRRCKSYEPPNVQIPEVSDEAEGEDKEQSSQPSMDLKKMAADRDAAISRHKAKKEVENRLKEMKEALKLKDSEETKREYYLLLLKKWVLRAVEELRSLKMEKSVLSGMNKAPQKTAGTQKKPEVKPLKPVIIVRTELQKKVFGMGYPSLPTMTVEEFYEQRYASAKNQVQPDEVNARQKNDSEAEEEKLERDDPEALQKARAFDDWKDEHRRGSGNTKNKG